MAAKGITNTAVWILMGLLILGLGGFGVTNLSGTIRSVGSVGETEISVDDYARALQNEIRALEAERGEPLTFAEARAADVDQRVLSRLVAEAALTEEARRLGISIGDQHLREQILDIPEFRGIDGTFDREAYRFALDQAGLDEADFEEDIRAEAARTLLQGAVVSGVPAPPTYTEALLDYVAERRDITFARLGRADLESGLPVPDEETLRAYHRENAARFTAPETRRITYALLTPEMLLDEVEVDEATLREAYEAQIDNFVQAERRLVERLAFPDAAAAQAAKSAIDAGELTFEEAVAKRGLDLADVDLGDVSEADLEAAAERVFAAEPGEVVGPVETPVGPALFRVNAVLSAQETSFEEAVPQLRAEIAGGRARRVVDNRVDAVDDLLAGGATIEELAEETELELGQIDWHPGISEGIGAYAAFREAALDATTEEFPEVIVLEDGGIFAMRLDEIVPPTLRPFDEVRDAVERAWRNEAVVEALRAQIEDDLPRLEAGADFTELGLEPEAATGLTRRGFEPGTPAEFIESVFELEEGGVDLLEGEGQLYVLRLDNVAPPSDEDPDIAQLREAVQEQVAAGLANDYYQALAADIRQRAGITLDQQAINAVHANFQ